MKYWKLDIAIFIKRFGNKMILVCGFIALVCIIGMSLGLVELYDIICSLVQTKNPKP